jgi:hypothetical protein
VNGVGISGGGGGEGRCPYRSRGAGPTGGWRDRRLGHNKGFRGGPGGAVLGRGGDARRARRRGECPRVRPTSPSRTWGHRRSRCRESSRGTVRGPARCGGRRNRSRRRSAAARGRKGVEASDRRKIAPFGSSSEFGDDRRGRRWHVPYRAVGAVDGTGVATGWRLAVAGYRLPVGSAALSSFRESDGRGLGGVERGLRAVTRRRRGPCVSRRFGPEGQGRVGRGGGETGGTSRGALV